MLIKNYLVKLNQRGCVWFCRWNVITTYYDMLLTELFFYDIVEGNGCSFFPVFIHIFLFFCRIRNMLTVPGFLKGHTVMKKEKTESGAAISTAPGQAAAQKSMQEDIARGSFLGLACSCLSKSSHSRPPEQTDSQPFSAIPIRLEYTLVTPEDAACLFSWLKTLKYRGTARTYGGAVLDVCDHFAVTLSSVTAEQWITYMRDILPKRNSRNAVRRLDRTSIYVHYYALTAFLAYYRALRKDFPSAEDLEEHFPAPPVPPPPAVRDAPDSEEVSLLLSHSGEQNPRVHAMIVLAYECLMTPEEIRVLKLSQIQKPEGSDETAIYVPTRRSSRYIRIDDDVMPILSAYIATLFPQSGDGSEPVLPCADPPLFASRGGKKPISEQYQNRCMHAMQEPFAASGRIRRVYPLSAFRKAGLNRILSVSEDTDAIARYAGVTGKYAARLKRFSAPDMASLPESSHSIRDMIAYVKAMQAEEGEDILSGPVEIRKNGEPLSSCPDMASALQEYIRLVQSGEEALSLMPLRNVMLK